MRKFYSINNVFGGKTYFNDEGETVAQSSVGIFGGEVLYNDDGDRIGYSVDGIVGGKTIYLDEEDVCDNAYDREIASEQKKETEREKNVNALRKKFFDDPWSGISNY